MRASVLKPAAVLAVLGAVVGVAVALGLRWWYVAHAPTDFGFYSYSPLPNAVNDSSPTVDVDGPGLWGLLWPAAVTGLVFGVAAAVVLALLGRHRTAGTDVRTGRLRGALTLGLSGAALGTLVVAVSYLRLPAGSEETTYHGRYVPMQGLESSKAYESTLDVTFDGQVREWFPYLPIGVGIGLALGLVVFGVLVLTKRRIAVISGSSPTG